MILGGIIDVGPTDLILILIGILFLDPELLIGSIGKLDDKK